METTILTFKQQLDLLFIAQTGLYKMNIDLEIIDTITDSMNSLKDAFIKTHKDSMNAKQIEYVSSL